MNSSLNTSAQNSKFSEVDFQNLNKALRENNVKLYFTKKDGTVRTMFCTLKPDALPVSESVSDDKKERVINVNVLAVWDTENQGWRSFRYDSVLSWEII